MFAVQYATFGPPDVLTLGEAEEPHAGPGRIRIAVRASAVTPADRLLRAGLLTGRADLPLPHIPGFDAAGVVDEIGAGVTGVAIGDEVFGVVDIARLGGGFAEFAELVAWEHKPAAFSWAQAGGAASGIETATRVLDLLGVTAGTTLLVDGAAGAVGTAAVQLAVARGATVLGTASAPNHDLLSTLGALPTAYGPGLAGRVAALAPGGVDAALDCAGKGSLADLVAITGSPDRVVTIADFTAAAQGVRLSATGGTGATAVPAYHGLAVAAALAADGRYTVPVQRVFDLAHAADAHRLGETGHARGKIVVTVP
jgi:NADPH:quinone reductase-like Zn-dependent oxidoreductase